MPPSVIIEKQLSYRARKQEHAFVITPKDYDYSQVMVYRKADFNRAAAAAISANFWFADLYAVLGTPRSEQARRQLLSDPLIQQALEPLCRESAPRLREILRPPVDGEPTPPECIDTSFGIWVDP